MTCPGLHRTRVRLPDTVIASQGDANGVLSKATAFFVNIFQRWMPDSFVVAVVLTLLTFLLSVTAAGFGPRETLMAWGDGFWGLLTFTNQIVLTLIFGYAVALTPPVNRLLKWIAAKPKTPTGAYLLVSFIGGVTALLSWGLSLVAGAIMARFTGAECLRRGVRVHYPLLVASGFSGFVIWHQGLSSSVGLTIATPGHFLEERIGLVPFAATIFTPWNIGVALAVLLTLPVLMSRLHPRDGNVEAFPHADEGDLGEAAPQRDDPGSPATKLENERWLNWLIVLAGSYYLIMEFVVAGTGLNLNLLNFSFLMLGLALTSSPMHYVNLIIGAARVAAPFLLQYPFYAGIAGVMAASGLAEMVVQGFVAIGDAQSMSLWAFFSAAILNFFIPSGGGQWAVQGPIIMDAANAVGADVADIAMAVMLGDQWTNLVHPLITIPVVAIAGLHVRQILGFCMVALLFTGVVFMIGIAFL